MTDSAVHRSDRFDWQKILPALVLAGSVAALGTAYIAQYGFGLAPCDLCLWQRVPYYVAGGLALVAMLPGTGRMRALLLALCALAFLADSAVAFHHVGVEMHWWGSFASCDGTLPQSVNAANLLAQLNAAPNPPCDQAGWVMFGVSAAVWNMLYAAALAVVTGLGVCRMRRRGA